MNLREALIQKSHIKLFTPGPVNVNSNILSSVLNDLRSRDESCIEITARARKIFCIKGTEDKPKIGIANN